jgi:ketopantoate hydroxymethyltransferase
MPGDAPPFAKRYAKIGEDIVAAARRYSADVKAAAKKTAAS